MANINLFIKENIKNVGKDIYVVPDIPEKKLNNGYNAPKKLDHLNQLSYSK